MSREQLETNIAALELLVNETADKSTDFKAQLEQAKKDLANVNKPELTPMQLDNIYEAIEAGVSEFDFSDTDNYDKDFELDYDGRVQLSNFDLTNHQDLVKLAYRRPFKSGFAAKKKIYFKIQIYHFFNF